MPAKKPTVLLELPQDEALALLNILLGRKEDTHLDSLLRGTQRLKRAVDVEQGPGGSFDPPDVAA